MTRLGTAAAVVLCLAACGRPAGSLALTDAEQRSEAHATAARVAESLRVGAARTCGSAPAPALVHSVVMVNARQCLSCRDLGYMLRRLKDHAPGGAVVVVVPAGDTAALCPYLREERVRLPVVSVPDDDRQLASARTLTLYRARPDQTLDSVFHAATGTELLKALQPRARAAQPASAIQQTAELPTPAEPSAAEPDLTEPPPLHPPAK